MKEYITVPPCERCGEKETFDGGNWIDADGGGHVVCAQCHEVLLEYFDEENRPEPELFPA